MFIAQKYLYTEEQIIEMKVFRVVKEEMNNLNTKLKRRFWFMTVKLAPDAPEFRVSNPNNQDNENLQDFFVIVFNIIIGLFLNSLQ